MNSWIPAAGLIVIGAVQMAGDVSGQRPIKAVGAALHASPAPKVFTAQDGFELLADADQDFGCGTMRMYGRGDFQPFGYCFFASSSETEPEMMTSSPCFQLTGVATLCRAVS